MLFNYRSIIILGLYCDIIRIFLVYKRSWRHVKMNKESDTKKEKIKRYKQIAEDIKKNIQMRKRPLIVEFAGLPKSGKTTVINSLSLF